MKVLADIFSPSPDIYLDTRDIIKNHSSGAKLEWDVGLSFLEIERVHINVESGSTGNCLYSNSLYLSILTM